MIAWWFHRVLAGYDPAFPSEMESIPSTLAIAGREELEGFVALASKLQKWN